jgi:3-hydroxy acid dehydrogenase / malonic semialdehyde reductase
MPRPLALVTGASAGIGRAACHALAAQGWSIIAVARRAERLDQLAAELAATGAACLPLALDIRDREAVFAALGALPPEWAGIELLVNNAGLALGVEPLDRGDPEDWDAVFAVNVRALLTFVRALVPGMVARGRGQVINIGSIAGRQTYPGGAVYCASKAAELALSRGLKLDLVDTPIRVTSIDPGLVTTEFSQVRFRGDTERAMAVYRDMEPLRPEDVAEAIAWCASRPARVQVAEMVLFPTCQASAQQVHRGPWRRP